MNILDAVKIVSKEGLQPEDTRRGRAINYFYQLFIQNTLDGYERIKKLDKDLAKHNFSK